VVRLQAQTARLEENAKRIETLQKQVTRIAFNWAQWFKSKNNRRRICLKLLLLIFFFFSFSEPEKPEMAQAFHEEVELVQGK
jgi:hypothetical protein